MNNTLPQQLERTVLVISELKEPNRDDYKFNWDKTYTPTTTDEVLDAAFTLDSKEYTEAYTAYIYNLACLRKLRDHLQNQIDIFHAFTLIK